MKIFTKIHIFTPAFILLTAQKIAVYGFFVFWGMI